MRCVREHNGNDTVLYSADHIGAFTRGESLEAAAGKMREKASAYVNRAGESLSEPFSVDIVQEKQIGLQICDAASDVIFHSER